MYDDVIDVLKAHEYFRGVSDSVLGEIASIATVTDYDAATTVHQLDDPLSSICFVLRGRLKAVRVDSRGDEHLFQIFQRGEQYGMMLGGLGESIPVRVFTLEPSTILSLDHEKSMELTLLYPDLRRQWLQSYARSLRRRFLEPAAGESPRRSQSCTNPRQHALPLSISSAACRGWENPSVFSATATPGRCRA